MAAELEVLNNSDDGSDTDMIDEITIIKTVSLCDRLKLMFKPIQFLETKYNEGDGETHIVVAPEPFRMFFYVIYLVCCGLGMFVSTKWGGVDTENNVIKDTFGFNNVCIYFDDPPFSLFFATLWMPVILCWLTYTILDYYRAYDSYVDKEISKGFWILYSIFTYYELFAAICTIQFTATSPYENLYIHTIPYLTMVYALCTLSLKKMLYFMKTGMFKDDNNKCWYYLGWIYIVAMITSIFIYSVINTFNLFGARLWEIEGLEWTQPLIDATDKVQLILTMVVPIFIYFIFTKDCKTITIIINRTRKEV